MPYCPPDNAAISDIILAGISLGGYGALLYAKNHLDEIDAVLLLAPFLGSQALVQAIANTGGLSVWRPASIPGFV